MDKERFIKTVIPLKPKLMILARKYISDEEDSKDVVQEVFAKLWMVRENLGRYENIGAFAARITKNICINLYKREGLRDSFVKNLILENSSDEASKEDESEHIQSLVAQLPDLQQLIMRMKYFDDLDVDEIAEILNCTREAIWMNLSRARKKMRELYEKSNR